MSFFGARRKARIINVDDDEGDASNSDQATENGSSKEGPIKPVFGSKSGRKPTRQSGLRKTVNTADDEGGKDGAVEGGGGGGGDDDDEEHGEVVIRPSINRPGSIKAKKRAPKSRINIGSDAGEADDGENVAAPQRVKPRQKVSESGALRKGIAARGLPLSVRPSHDEDDRPRYSREYLDELQSSTPNTPQDLSTLTVDDADEMDLDPSELEGAVIVESSSSTVSVLAAKHTTQILTEAEIREKKERRARLAKEQNFLSVEDEDEEEDEDGLRRKKKDDTRLVAEDEDLGEGFDNFVEDGGLSLGRRAEKERRKQDRQKMAELINDAEGHSSDESSDGDAERRIAYEAAQTRAGMDGLKKPRKDPSELLLQVPPKITPLPNLADSLAKLQLTLKAMRDEIEAKAVAVAALRQEKEEIQKREVEVQALLDETGKKYQEAMGRKDVPVEVLANTVARPGAELIGERGLESLGLDAKS
ncbi:hypothetical protein ESCO_002507 [Escovopsis weberi]|uniref:Nineteen complex-related protein 2-domain-containing protein n=1 Tax=Escovopsis weberi TaxID=150374 RepID=A0A0M8MSV2_ESCWE|nr:hypothetical protein ESCO_002507 [Escovopsis weberi]